MLDDRQSQKNVLDGLSKCITYWMEKNLPNVDQDWIKNILDTNSTKPYEDIEKLTLSSKLEILNENWFLISSKNRWTVSNRGDIQRICKLLSNPDKKNNNSEYLIDDEDKNSLTNLITIFGGSEDLKDSVLKIGTCSNTVCNETLLKNKADLASTPVQLNIGTLVNISGDTSKVGAIIGNNGDTYKVLVNNHIETFYGPQLSPVISTQSFRKSLNSIIDAITAHQILNPGSRCLYSLNAARIDFVPYQFRPALKLIKSELPRILIADDVGVGKTIEAGLILKELQARSNIDSVLVICPRPLVSERKWVNEMKRFDENFINLDGADLREALYEMDRDGVWPERFNKIVVPYSLFNENLVMGSQTTKGKKINVGLTELDPLPHFDLVIVDEAHTIRNQNTWAHRTVELFCENAESIVFLTATPLQNSNDDLFSLLNLLRPDVVFDKDTFHTMSEPNCAINDLLRTIRARNADWRENSLSDLSHILDTNWGRKVIQHNPLMPRIYEYIEKEDLTREERVDLIHCVESLHTFDGIINRTRRRDIEDFCIRRTQTVNVSFTPLQERMYSTLINFEMEYLMNKHSTPNVLFMMCTLMRQASSCIYGLAPFLKDILTKRISDMVQEGELEEPDSFSEDIDTSVFKTLSEEIEKNSNQLEKDDPKYQKLCEILNIKKMEDNPRVIIFSTFRHTLRYLRKNLERSGFRCGQIDGSVPDEDRYDLRNRFAMDTSNEKAIDVLLFSEVGCEGLDYQFCDTIINYDLPWNPMRIEQRIGRIDRRGQKSDTVRIYNIITEGTIDSKIYDKCLNKIGIFEDNIGDCAEILGSMNDKLLQIMFDPTLTEEEKDLKLEKMAENDVMKIQEINRLEQDEKTLFGFDLSEYIQNKAIQDAEDEWVTPYAIEKMICAYIKSKYHLTDAIIGKSEIKTLRLSAEVRNQLMQELKSTPDINKNAAYLTCIRYLKSNKPTIQITFDSQCAMDNREIMFITQTHPLSILAASNQSDTLPATTSIIAYSEDISAGIYPFRIYSWNYIGLKTNSELKVISTNNVVSKKLSTILRTSKESEISRMTDEMKSDLDSIHRELWEKERGLFTDEVNQTCEYRIKQLSQSFAIREKLLNEKINSATDERIARMYSSQLSNVKTKFDVEINEFEQISKKTDIHTSLLLEGTLQIEGNQI